MLSDPDKRIEKRSRASLIILIVLAFLLMAATAVLVTRLPDDEPWQWAVQGSPDEESGLTGFTCDTAEAQTLYPFQDGIIRLTPGRVTYLDILGSERFAVDVDFTAPFALHNGRQMLVADHEGTAYLMISENGEVYRGRLAGNAGGAAISVDGTVALIQDRQDSTGIVTVLEAGSGRHLYDCHFPESGYVLSVAFTPDGTHFDVNIINTDGSAAYAVLKRFTADGRQLGQRLPDLASLHPLLLHDPAGDPVLCGYGSIAALAYGQDRLRWQQAYTRIHAAAADGRGVWVLAQKSSHELLGLFRIDPDGQETKLLEIGDSAAGPALSDRYVAIGSGSRVLVLDSRSGAVHQTQTLSASIIRLAFTGQGSLLIVTANGVSRLPLDN